MGASSIGIMSGSFNPVHNGHIGIAHSFLESKYIDELWVLLTPESPHKKNENLASYAHRLQMLNAVFSETPGIRVSDFEKSLSTPSYTFNTIVELKKAFPEKDFFLCLGADSFKNFKTWFKWEEIIDLVSILIASRPGYSAFDNELRDKVFFVEHEEIKISSTKVREKIYNEDDVTELVPKHVLSYIHEHNLYAK